ncbi:MAG: 3-isopropylmalate dehydratase [Alphaproteobacteria bacterium]
MNWIYRGRCWKVGDNIGVDGDLMPLRFAMQRETDPDVLRPYFMEGYDPEMQKQVAPGDILVAGKRFAQGNPHIQGLIGIQANGLGLVVESIPHSSFRMAVNAGLPFLPRCPGVTAACENGDNLEVDFASGLFRNLTHETEIQYDPLPSKLLETIALGGWKPMVARRVAEARARQ